MVIDYIHLARLHLSALTLSGFLNRLQLTSMLHLSFTLKMPNTFSIKVLASIARLNRHIHSTYTLSCPNTNTTFLLNQPILSERWCTTPIKLLISKCMFELQHGKYVDNDHFESWTNNHQPLQCHRQTGIKTLWYHSGFKKILSQHGKTSMNLLMMTEDTTMPARSQGIRQNAH